MTDHMPLGAQHRADGSTSFALWAPGAQSVELLLLDPAPRALAMARDERGVWRAVADAPPGTRYLIRRDAGDGRPDPASRHQPEGVHGPSAVVDHAFAWGDAAWRGIPLADYVIYELHVGTFTPAGTFEAIIPHLAGLRDLGVTAIELMPVAHFPGARNWGYDGVYPYAPHHAYGGVAGLKRLVDAAHQAGLAVILDVVYNHLGPEGNYLWGLAPEAFTDHYRTAWGPAVNFDGAQSAGARRLVIENALEWLREYHLDGLRLDATHAIYDMSPYHILEELAARAQAQAARLGRPAVIFAEHGGNDPRLARPSALGGYGLDGIWSDDFHHALHTLLTGERSGYYEGFGSLAQLATALERSFVYAGDYMPHASKYVGRDPQGLRPEQLVVCMQNHDQVGNRALGDRLGATLSMAQLRLAAAATLLSPFTPLIFMGEEYAEPAPFQYFTDHSDPGLVAGVRAGRQREFAAFMPPGVAVPDPQDPATFARSRLDQGLRAVGAHAAHQALYAELLALRHELRERLRERPRAHVVGELIRVERPGLLLLLNFGAGPARAELPAGGWRVRLDTERAAALAPGELAIAAHSAVLLDLRAGVGA